MGLPKRTNGMEDDTQNTLFEVLKRIDHLKERHANHAIVLRTLLSGLIWLRYIMDTETDI